MHAEACIKVILLVPFIVSCVGDEEYMSAIASMTVQPCTMTGMRRTLQTNLDLMVTCLKENTP